MKVPFRLRHRSTAEPASALLILSHRPEDVLRLCARLGHDPLPAIFPVADGFLLKLTRPADGAVAGCVRLRGLSEDLLLPVDADLEPALLPDEAEDLVRQRGLVFLPGGRVLEFAPGRPLPPAALLGAPVRRAPWRSLPRPGPLAERITEVVVETPPEAADEILEAGGEGIGTEAPRPADSGLPSKALGKAAMGLGKGLAWLGHKLGLGALTGAGAKLIAGALALAPRLSEALMGRQEASLQELLRDFRAGNVEKALRRALPLGGDKARGSDLHQGERLPSHNPSYSLWDILRGHGGAGGRWHSSADTYRDLEQEYRKVAEQAARDGDYRRAAFIYGKLLGDYRAAAAALAQGGLHRDAALIYLHKLHDPYGAAREYEAAGDVDRALSLYRKCGEHALAGDLLRRAGEEELAAAEYQLAAAKLAADGGGHYQAGELLLSRAGRPDLAVPYYQEDWQRRPHGSPIPCALRLAQIHAQQEKTDRLLTLLTEAEVYLSPGGNDAPAGEFFNEIARLAGQPALAPLQDELRDRALLGLAGKVRQRVEGGAGAKAITALMGAGTVWAPPVVSDAEFAVKRTTARREERAPARSASTLIRARVPVVTAVCWAPGSGAIVLGFQSGEVVLFRPLAGEVVPISREDHPILSLASSTDGDTLVVLSGGEGPVGYVANYTRNVGYRMTTLRPVQPVADPWLCPLLVGDTELAVVGLWDGSMIQFLMQPQLLTTAWWDPEASLSLSAALILPSAVRWMHLFAFAGSGVGYWEEDAAVGLMATTAWKPLCWQPCVPPESSLRRPPLAWLMAESQPDKPGGCLELAGIGFNGMLCWARVEFAPKRLDTVRPATMSMAHPCLAATLIKPGLVVAITARAVYWFRVVGQGFAQAAVLPGSFPNAVACFPHHRGNELIVVCGDGTLVRLAMPQV